MRGGTRMPSTLVHLCCVVARSAPAAFCPNSCLWPFALLGPSPLVRRSGFLREMRTRPALSA
jgi:hypothetical protein